MSEAKRKILVVDNDRVSIRLLKTTLNFEEFDFLYSSRGMEVIELAENEKPDLIFLNLVLEDISSMELINRLRANPRTSGIRFIIHTDDPEHELTKHIGETAIDDFIIKPYSPIELLKKIHQVLNDRDTYNDISITSSQDLEIVKELENRDMLEQTGNKLEEQLLMYALDVSRLHKRELSKNRETRKAYDKLKESERMKDMFIALVSHELRTPLSVIKGYLYLLQEVLNKTSIEQDISSFIIPISKAADRLEDLMGELLDFSRMKSGLLTFEKKEINIPNFLDLILKEYKSKFDNKKIRVKININGEFRPIKADYERLKAAFTHFIRNAYSFTKENGTFTITCRDEGIWVEIKFADTGRGISKENLDRIFTPFYQSADFLTREVGGMGLGLAIAKHIVEDHGGTIRVESEEGKGSTFIIQLPRSYQDAKEIVAELKQTYPKQIEELSKNLKATQEQLLAYAQELSSVYAKEKQRTRQLEETLNALERTYIQTIAALSRTVDLKDAYVTAHTDRVSFYAYAIAKKLNPELISERNFKYSLLLHDIGKIGVAEEILTKVEKLTEEEWKILKDHPAKGVEILKDIEFLAPALSAVRSHHERWDGKGYPDGMKGEEIPLEARIIAVADSFDAMITDRPYRKGMSLEEAKEEISRQSSHQFDPEVVKCFLEVWPEIIDFTKQINTRNITPVDAAALDAE